MVEVVPAQCNWLDFQYRRKSEVLYIFIPNKSHAYLLNVEPSYLAFLKSNNADFDHIIITCTDKGKS